MRWLWMWVLISGCELPLCEQRGVICTVAGVGGTLGFNGDALDPLGTWMYQPSAIALAPDAPIALATPGSLVIDDFNNMRIRTIGDDDLMRTLVGSGVHGNATVGVPVLESPLENPVDIAFGPEGELYIAELHGMRVLRVDGDGLIEPWAGVVAEPGYSGEGGDATVARFNNVSSVAVDEAGSVYVADTGNHCIRRVDPDHTVHLIAGTPMLPGFVDGVEGNSLNLPQRVRYLDGKLWIADTNNHAVRLLDLASGELTTLVGTGTPGFSGDEGPATEAQLNGPFGAHPTEDGGLYIADSYNNRVRYVDPDGVIHTFAGDGQKAFGGDEGYAVDAQLNFPSDVVPDAGGALWFTDMFNGAVRHIAGKRP